METGIALKIGDLVFRIHMDRRRLLFSFIEEYFHRFIVREMTAGFLCNLSVSFSTDRLGMKPYYTTKDSTLYYDPAGKAYLIIHEGEGFLPLYNALYLLTSLMAVLQGGCLFHGAGVAYKGKGFLFVGPSGAGKTTIASLLEEVDVLSDEAVGVRMEEGYYTLFATPFGARYGEKRDWGEVVHGGIMLSRIFYLKKDTVNSLERIDLPYSIGPLLSNIPFVNTFRRSHIEKLLSALYRTARTVPVEVLRFRKDKLFLKGVIENG